MRRHSIKQRGEYECRIDRHFDRRRCDHSRCCCVVSTPGIRGWIVALIGWKRQWWRYANGWRGSKPKWIASSGGHSRACPNPQLHHLQGKRNTVKNPREARAPGIQKDIRTSRSIWEFLQRLAHYAGYIGDNSLSGRRLKGLREAGTCVYFCQNFANLC